MPAHHGECSGGRHPLLSLPHLPSVSANKYQETTSKQKHPPHTAAGTAVLRGVITSPTDQGPGSSWVRAAHSLAHQWVSMGRAVELPQITPQHLAMRWGISSN